MVSGYGFNEPSNVSMQHTHTHDLGFDTVVSKKTAGTAPAP